MPLINDLTINLSTLRIHLGASLGVFYQVRDLYSLVQDLFDETGATALAGAMSKPVPFSAQTPTDYTIKGGWYMSQQSYRRLKGGSIQTSGFNTVIYKLSFGATYINAVASDIGKTVTNGTATGILLDYDNAAKWWRIRSGTGAFTNSNSITITSGTGAGTLAATNAVATGEEGHSNAYTVGSVLHGGTYIIQGITQLDTSDWYEAGNAGAGNVDVDVLVKIREVGTLIASGIASFFNRNNRSAAGGTNGDTYDWYSADLSGFGRNPIPLSTRADLADNLTDATAATYTQITISTGTFNVDVDGNGTAEVYSGRIDAGGQPLSIVYPVLKYLTRSGATANLIAGVPANQFTTLNPAYSIVKDSPIASFAGGKLFLARGWVIVNVAQADASNYQASDNAGNTNLPPQFFLRAVTGLTVGQKVLLAVRSAPDTARVDEFKLATGNTSGSGTLTLASSVPLDKPTSGFVRVFDNSGNEDRYAYTSFSGAVLTLSGTLSKNYNANNNAYIPYIDTIATGTSVSISSRYVSDRDVTLGVRLGTGVNKMIPFSSNYTLSNADSSVPATVLVDTINNNA